MAQPLIGYEEKQAVMDVLSSRQLAQGKWVYDFEAQFAQFIGTKYAIATSSGTTALHLALLAAGVDEGDEVITTPFSFIASANSILYCGATPVFVDVDYDTFTINADLIEAKITDRTKAILPVHLFGLPANMGKIMAIAYKYKLKVIEDSCQAHGAMIKTKKIGGIGDAGCFSFYPTKNMTTGEGGMITTNDESIAEKARLLREHGMKVRYYHDSLGYNFRMTNIAAAIGIEQLKKLEEFNRRRRENAARLNEVLSSIENIGIPTIPDGYTHVFHQYTVRIQNGFSIKKPTGYTSIFKQPTNSSDDKPMTRDEFMTYLGSNGVGSAIYYPVPIHKQKVYMERGYTESFPVAEKLSTEVLSLPVHPGVRLEEI